MAKDFINRVALYIKNKRLLSFFCAVKRIIYEKFVKPDLVYAPNGWKTKLSNGKIIGWNAPSVVNSQRVEWEAFINNLKRTGHLGFNYGHTDLSENRNVSFHNAHITYGYVLVLAAHLKKCISILDYGGGLGHYYQIAKTLLPDVVFEFHCKEVPSIAEAGKLLNPEILWHIDDTCLERTYDLVMIDGSLQYMENWEEVLQKVSTAVGGYLLLTSVPVVENADSFVAIQKAYDTRMLHWQFNKHALLQVIRNTGLSLMREFVIGEHPYIKNAPEQCEMCGWLFKR